MINIIFIVLVILVAYWAYSVTINNTKEWDFKNGWFTKKYWFHFYLAGVPTILACFYIIDLLFLSETINAFEMQMYFEREDYGGLSLIALSILWLWKRFTVNYQKENF
tara:strand:- start:379 stop:702 length:324 start_codon:yes stop_codon:yes gene_type:complete